VHPIAFGPGNSAAQEPPGPLDKDANLSLSSPLDCHRSASHCACPRRATVVGAFLPPQTLVSRPSLIERTVHAEKFPDSERRSVLSS
jgi:hypothetical protein